MTFNPDHGADHYDAERESLELAEPPVDFWAFIDAMDLGSSLDDKPARLNPDVPLCAPEDHHWVTVRFCGGTDGCGLVEGLETDA